MSEKRSTLSYVIINPSCDLKLEEGDVIYLIRPSPIKNRKTFLTRGNSIRSIRRKRSTRGSASNAQNTPSPQPHNHLIMAPNDGDEAGDSADQALKSGAITPVSQHPSISEENEQTYEDAMRNNANQLFVGEIELHVPTNNVVSVDRKDWLGADRMNERAIPRNFDFTKYFSNKQRVPASSII